MEISWAALGGEMPAFGQRTGSSPECGTLLPSARGRILACQDGCGSSSTSRRTLRSSNSIASSDPAGSEPTASLMECRNPQQELADRPILGITPEAAEPWVGVFYGGQFGVPPAATGRLIAWPDAASFCVVYAGGGVVVRADDPTRTYEIDAYPVTGTYVVPERGIVVFADFTSLAAYDDGDLRWRSRRLALDDVRVEGVDGDALRVAGFFGGGRLDRFIVDLATGEASGQRFQPPE